MRRTLLSLLGLALAFVVTIFISRVYASCSSTTPNLGLANCTIGTARSIVDPAWINNFLLLDLGFTSPLSISGVGSASPTVSLGTVPETKGGTNQTTYTTGDTLYASGANTLSKLSGNTTTTRKFRQQHGNGTAVTSESWDVLTEPDLPATRITAVTQFSNSVCSDDQVILKSGGAWVCGSTIGSGDITDVWTCTSGNCNAITGASGDSLNASGADSSIPWKTGTTAPGTCSVGMAFFDTDATAGQNVYGCTATNTWTLEGGAGGSGDITDVWACTSGNCNALTAASGDTLDAKNADSTAPNKSGTTAPGTCSVGQTFFDTDATAGNNIYGCTATNTWTLEGDGGGAGAGDITDVWNTTSGNVNALVAASGDSLDAGSADSTIACKKGTSLPGTCTVGECYFKTDATAGLNVYGCTATNTWTLEGDGGGGGSGDITDVWACTSGNCNALTAASGDTLDATSADSTIPNKSGTSAPGTCSVGMTFFDTDATAGQNIYGCTATNTWTLEGDGGGGSSLPVSDATSIVQGSSTSSKQLRFEVDGFTASTTRVLTPQNADYTIAGVDLDNSFSANQTISKASAALLLNATSGAPTINLELGGTIKSLLGVAHQSDGLITGSLTGDTTLRVLSGLRILLSLDNGTKIHAFFDRANDAGLMQLTGAATGDPSVYFDQNGTLRAILGVPGATDRLITGAAVGDLTIRTQSHPILLSVDGGVLISAAIVTTSTAGETFLKIRDVDNGALERVTVGAADSCGSGFKCLRIPN